MAGAALIMSLIYLLGACYTHTGATPWRLSEVLGIGLWRRNEYEEDNVVQPGRRGAATDWRGNRT